MRTPRSQRPRVVVVGAGISGLAAAHRLSTTGVDLDVLVLEASPRVGGKLLLDEVAGVTVDVGAEALLNRRPEAVSLARSIGLGDDLCHPATTSSSIWTRSALRPLPPNVLGVPTDLPALRRSGVLPAPAVARVALGNLTPHPAPAADVSVGDFVTRGWGRAVTDRLVEPLLGGVYAGHADHLSLQATAPQIADLGAGRRRPASSEPVFAGIAGGVGRLPEAVARASGATVRVNATVRGLRRADRWELVVGPAGTPEVLTADAVVLATPAAATAQLLRAVAPTAAAELLGIEYASTAVVTLAVPTTALPWLSGSGFLVPAVDRRAIKAVTFATSKWAWLAAAAGPDLTVLRASVGRQGEEWLVMRDDADLVRLASSDLADATGLSQPPVDATVTRWGGGLPQYAVGHRDRVARIRGAVTGLPGLEICGAAYDGIGVAACVADGQRAADRLAPSLAARETMAP